MVTPCGYVARIICFHFCSCRYNCIVGSYLPLILVLNLVGPAKRFSDNKYIYPISSSFIAVSVYWRTNKPKRIYNSDETGVSTEHSPPRIVCNVETSCRTATLDFFFDLAESKVAVFLCSILTSDGVPFCFGKTSFP